MMKRLFLIFAITLPCALFASAQSQNHGVSLTLTASPSAASCTGTCVGSYLIFEGPSAGQENMATPLTTISGLTYTDNGTNMNSYLGTTRCYVAQFQEVASGLTLTSASSNEVCFSFPAIPSPPQAGGTIH